MFKNTEEKWKWKCYLYRNDKIIYDLWYKHLIHSLLLFSSVSHNSIHFTYTFYNKAYSFIATNERAINVSAIRQIRSKVLLKLIKKVALTYCASKTLFFDIVESHFTITCCDNPFAFIAR